MERSISERVTALEVKVDDLSLSMTDANKKLDSLLELKNKGMGAFWLVSVLMGAAFTTIVTFFTDWIH